MAGSWGTKVEAAFNQSPLLAGCLEELAEERVGAAGGEKAQGGEMEGAAKGLPVLGTPWDPAIPHHPLKEKAR